MLNFFLFKLSVQFVSLYWTLTNKWTTEVNWKAEIFLSREIEHYPFVRNNGDDLTSVKIMVPSRDIFADFHFFKKLCFRILYQVLFSDFQIVALISEAVVDLFVLAKMSSFFLKFFHISLHSVYPSNIDFL